MKSIFNFLFIFGGIIVFNYVDAAIDYSCSLPIIDTDPNDSCAAQPMYGYDTSKKQCVRYIFNSCRSTANMFSTLHACEKACIGNDS